MAPKISKSRSSRAVLAAALVAAARLSLDTQKPAFAPLPRQPRVPAVGLRAEQGSELVVVRDPARIKEQLLDAPSKALVSALEKVQVELPHLTSLKELEGTWELRGPKASSVSGLASGDLPRAILGLYQGPFGRLLNMELLSPPRVTIAASGAAETLSRLRWGSQRDEIVEHRTLSLKKENVISVSAKSIRSKALKVNLPSLARPSTLKVTFFDGNMLILRDSRGNVDVLVRTRTCSKEEPCDSSSDSAAPQLAAPEEQEVQRVVEAGSEADQLLAEVNRLKAQLQTERKVAAEQRVERASLQGQVKRLDKELGAVAVKAKADSVKLSVMEQLKESVAENAKSQQETTAEKERARLEIAAEVSSLTNEITEMEQKQVQYDAREVSLRQQITTLQKALASGAREEWPGYRAALSKARSELKDVRSEMRKMKNVIARVRKSLDRKQQEESRATPVVEAEAAVRQQLEVQLDEQSRELDEQRDSLSEKEAAEEALRAELDAAKLQLAQLEQREVEAKERAEQVEREISDVVEQVDEAQKTAKGLGSEIKRKFWPWR